MNEVIIIGYSGHAYVIVDAIFASGGTIKGYCDEAEKEVNPFGLNFLGNESASILSESNWIIGIGDNLLREKINSKYKALKPPISIVHPSAVIGAMSIIEDGVFVAANVTINPFVRIANGVIVNTGAIIEHECVIGEFSHIAPGAVLAGNVKVGNGSFVGANSVVKQGIKIGNNVIIGAGSVVLKDVPNDTTVVGNPARKIK